MSKVMNSVVRNIVVKAPLEKVWNALTKPEHLNCWYTKEANLDFRIGGRGEMDHGWGATSSGIFTEIDELQRFVLESEDGTFRTITILEEVENGVRVSIAYETDFSGEEGEAAKENMLFGTYQFLKNLKSVYESNVDNRPHMWKSSIGIVHTSSKASKGSKVLKVGDKSVAHHAGIKVGDVVTLVDDDVISDYESLESAINRKEPGKTVRLTVLREEKIIELLCNVASYPVSYE